MPDLILNVDDSNTVRRARTVWLQDAGLEVIEGATGEEAVREAERRMPAVVLLDVSLPDISGFEVCRRLKANAATSLIQVLHVTASAVTTEELAQGLEAADSYLIEPVNPDALIAHVKALVRTHRALRDRERLLGQLRETVQELEAVMDAVPAAIVVGRDPECRVVIGNRMSEELFGLEPATQAGPGIRALRNGADVPPDQMPARKAAITGVPVRDYGFDLLCPDGSSRSLFGHAMPIIDEAGRVRGAVSAFIDVTDRKRMEEQLRQAQKLESIGLLAGGIAHDFNNLLTSMIGSTSLAMEGLTPLDPNYGLLDQVVRSGEKAAELTRQLLAYSGKGRWVLSKVVLSAVVRETLALLGGSIPATADIDLQLSDTLPEIEADAVQMNQIVMNLVLNAAESLEERAGTILIRTDAQFVDQAYLDSIQAELPPGEYVVLEVHDTGCGIDPDSLGRIFDPFFTTKFTGRGLGLAAVQGIVRAHHGTIHVRSDRGRGTSFRLLFPPLTRAKPGPLSPPAATRTEELRTECDVPLL